MGNQAWTEALDWPGANHFRAAETKNFKVKSNGKIAGQYKSAEGLTFMRVRPVLKLELTECRYMVLATCTAKQLVAANRRVPYDQPENSLAVFNEWLARSI